MTSPMLPVRILDTRVLETLVRPQYEHSCGLTSITSALRYLFDQDLEQETVARLVGQDITSPQNPGNSTIRAWTERITTSLRLPVETDFLFGKVWRKKGGDQILAWQCILELLDDPTQYGIVHVESHYVPLLGAASFPPGTQESNYRDTWIFLADPSPAHRQSRIRQQHRDISPPIWSMAWDELWTRFVHYPIYGVIRFRKVRLDLRRTVSRLRTI